MTGPHGRPRKLIEGDANGLWFEHSTMPGNTRLWEFDCTHGILTFNVRHPIWVKLDETRGKHLPQNARWIMHLQEWLALQVLNLLLHHPQAEEFDLHRDFVDEQIRPYVEMFIVGSPAK